MKKKKAGLYDPYLDVLGGGEKYLLQMLATLEELGYEPTIFWDANAEQDIEKRLNIKFKSLQFNKNIFTDETINPLQRFLHLKEFDVFLYISDGSYFFSGAKKNIVHAMVPRKDLYLGSSFNRVKHLNWQFVANSYFTRSHLNSWGINATVLYPFLDKNFIDSPHAKKENIILSVGRFFSQLHSKNQDAMVDIFLRNKDLFKNHTLILAGGLKKEDEDYVTNLKKIVGKTPNILIKPNVSYNELLGLYIKAKYYWHFAGFGVNPNKNPELVEHFGITPVEAMAMRCITFCFNAGGPKELITDGVNGYLFDTEEDLVSKFETIMKNDEKQDELIENARTYIQKNFSHEVYKEKLKKLL